MIMCVLLCYPVSIHMSQLLSTGHPISSWSYSISLEIHKTVPVSTYFVRSWKYDT